MEITWDNISIQQFKDIFNSKIENFNTVIEWKMEMISILYDIDFYEEMTDDMDVEELNQYYVGVNYITSSQPSLNNITKLGDYYLKSFEEITFGEFIDLDYFFKESYVDNLEIILAILFKQKNIDSFGNESFEPYEYNPNDRIHLFKDLMINDVYGIIIKYINYKEKLYAIYKSVFFNDETIIEEDDDLSDLTGQERRQYLIDKKKEEQKAKYSWDIILDKLTNKDMTKEDNILNMSAIRIFNKLSMLSLFE